jgi:hypothetical protein
VKPTESREVPLREEIIGEFMQPASSADFQGAKKRFLHAITGQQYSVTT